MIPNSTIRDTVIRTRKHLRDRYEVYADLQMIRQVLEDRIKAKITQEIVSVFEGYSGPELAYAAEILAEIEAMEAVSEQLPAHWAAQ